MQNLEDLKYLLNAPKNIVIIPHVNPDADALGSCLAIAIYLRKLGHRSTVISPNKYPRFLFWMPSHDEVLVFDEGNQIRSRQILSVADLIFFMDFSDPNRMGDLQSFATRNTATKILIDHHLDKKDFADFQLWDTTAAATAELVYDFIIMTEGKHLLDLDIAACIYAGIMTDTGSFKFPKTSAKLHRIIADLLDLGLDNTKIHQLVYDTNTQDRIKFLGYILDKKLCFLNDYYTAYIAVTDKEQRQFNTQKGDTEGLVNYGLSVEGVKIAAIFVQKEKDIKISFRSVGSFSVAHMAAKYFNGGGHKNAAGGILHQVTLEDALRLFLKVLPNYKKQIEIS